jgi:hypothetical protein
MGKASRRKKARRQRFQNPKTFVITESTLEKVVEALQQDADSQEALPENKTDFSACPDCWATEGYAALSQTIYWGEWRCVMCDRHRGWIENPANTVRRQEENQLIDRLLQLPLLGTWERMFLRSIYKTQKRSPRQIQKLNEIASKAESLTRLQGGES